MASPTRGARPAEPTSTTSDDDACAVCLDPWASAGPHRVAALKCGHLFGLSCIEEAVAATGRCPLCAAAATRADVVPLFVTRLTAADGTAAAETERIAAAEAAARAAAEAALAKARANVAELKRRVARLTRDKARLVHVLESVRKDGKSLIDDDGSAADDDAPVDAVGRPARRPRLAEPPAFTHRLTIPLPGVTALDACASAGVAVAGAASTLRRCSLLAPSFSTAIALPLTSVRCVALADANIALAVGRGSAAGVAGAVVDARCGMVAASLAAAPFPALCGVWGDDASAPSTSIVLGLTSGGLATYDTRKPVAPVAVAPPSGAPRPVHTLCGAPGGRLLAATAAGGTLWERSEDEWAPANAPALPTDTACCGAAVAGNIAALVARTTPAAPPALALWSVEGEPHLLGTTGPAPAATAARSVAVVEGDTPLGVVGAGSSLVAWPLTTGVSSDPILLPSVPGGDVTAVAGGGGGVVVAATGAAVSVVRRGE